jgi:hypothetical protein
MMLNKKIAAAVAVAYLAGVARADDTTADATPDARCIHQVIPTDFVRIWDLDLGQTDIKKVSGLPCDGGKTWSAFDSDNGWVHSESSGITNTVGNLLIQQVMDDLQAMGDNDNASAYYCPDGIQYFWVHPDYEGCDAKEGTKLTVRNKTYQNTDTTWLQSVKAIVSYGCTHQARRKDIGVSYTAVVSNDECRGALTA